MSFCSHFPPLLSPLSGDLWNISIHAQVNNMQMKMKTWTVSRYAVPGLFSRENSIKQFCAPFSLSFEGKKWIGGYRKCNSLVLYCWPIANKPIHHYVMTSSIDGKQFRKQKNPKRAARPISRFPKRNRGKKDTSNSNNSSIYVFGMHPARKTQMT